MPFWLWMRRAFHRDARFCEGRRWAIEDAFETDKTELGLAHNETRSWHGWHRHVSLVMLAFAMMAAVRHRTNHLPPPKRTSRVRQNVS